MPSGSYPHTLGYHVEIVRRVWAAVSTTPLSTQRELAAATGLAASTVNKALMELRWAGYVDFAPYRKRTMQIVVPFFSC